MAYSNYRGEWNRDRNERWRTRDRDEQYSQRDDDDSRLARESMERDYYGSESRGGYGGRGEYEEPRYGRSHGWGERGQDYSQREMGQGGRYSQGGRLSESGYGRGREYLGSREYSGGRHYDNDSGGWEGREREQWANRDVHGEYDRGANYGGYGRNQGYGQGYGRQDYGSDFRQQGYGQMSYSSSGRPSGGRAYGDYTGSPSGYFGDEQGSRYGAQWRSPWSSQGRGQWGSQEEHGQYRGRGPRGYRRADDRIREEVCDCLTDDEWLDASNIEVTVKDGEVTLSGTATSREDKRWAETLAERISGVKEVQNSIRVQEQRMQSGTQSGTQTGMPGAGGTGTSGRDKGKESSIQH